MFSVSFINLHGLLADAVLILHVAFVGFVVVGLLLILIGGLRRWAWVRNPWFRALHLAGIGVVVAQAWAGVICPLTTWEMALRTRAGQGTYQGTFISHWFRRLLYFELPLWVFTVAYTLFALAVIAGWWWVRPRRFSGKPKAS